MGHHLVPRQVCHVQVWWIPPLHEQPATVLLQSSAGATWGSLGWLLGSWIWWLILWPWFFSCFFPEHFHLWFLIHFSEFSARLFFWGDFWLCSLSVSVRVHSRDEKGTRGPCTDVVESSCLVANSAQRPRYAGGGSLWMASFWYCKQGDFWRIRAAAEQCSGIRFWRNHLERALCWHPWCGTVTMMAHVLWTGKW